MNKRLSAKSFVFSNVFILIAALALLFGLYHFLNKDFSATLGNYLPVTKESSSFNVNLDNPDDNIITSDKSIIVSGSTSPNVTLIISTETSDLGLEADYKGGFSKVITLTKGLNIITIKAFDEKGADKTIYRTVYYTEEKL
jgi:hypothetical protein